MNKWNDKAWLEAEIDDVMDAYSNTREQATQHVRDLLEEGEYRDELTDEQVADALVCVRGMQTADDTRKVLDKCNNEIAEMDAEAARRAKKRKEH